jgi:hypothetical protein
VTRSITVKGNEWPVRLAGFSFVEAARNGEVGQGGMNLDSENAAFDLNSHWDVAATDSDATGELYAGFVGDKDLSRGKLPPVGTNREFAIDLVDVNTLLGDRIIRTGGNRPAETDIERITWLVGSGYLADMAANIGAGGETNLDKSDLRGQYPRDCLTQAAEMAGKLFFAYRDPDNGDAVTLFYDLPTASNFVSTARISSVLADVGTVTPPEDDVTTYAFSFAFDTANLDTGVTVWTPAVGELLVDAWMQVDTPFNGTTPKADISQFTGAGAPIGLFGWLNGSGVSLVDADNIDGGGGPLTSPNYTTRTLMMQGETAVGNLRNAPARFTTTDPLLLVVSQDGTKGGTPIGGAAGAAVLYFQIVTPTVI